MRKQKKDSDGMWSVKLAFWFAQKIGLPPRAMWGGNAAKGIEECLKEGMTRDEAYEAKP